MISRFILFLSPLALWLGWLLISRLRGRGPRRLAVTVSLSLLVLLYFLTVVGTGVFWVAAQELPVFDWHYLPGYVFALMTLTHVALHWRNITSFFRRRAPAAFVEPGGARFRVPLRAGGYGVLAVLVGGVVYALGVRQGSHRIVVATGRALAPAAALAAGAMVPSVEIDADGVVETLAQHYHAGSSYPARAALPGLTLAARPDVYKSYPGARAPLPQPRGESATGVLDAYEAWRTGNVATDTTKLTLADLSELLYYTQGISVTKQARSFVFELRTAPSAGALYPVNVYVAALEVEGLAPGIYYYHPKDEALVLVTSDVMSVYNIEEACAGPGWMAEAPAFVVLSTTFGRTAFKYETRAYRYVAMDTGHAAYNLALCAAGLGWNAPLIARFDDRAVNSQLGLDPSEEGAFLLIPITRRETPAPEPRFELEGMPAGPASFVELIHGGTSLRRAGGDGSWSVHPAHPAQPVHAASPGGPGGPIASQGSDSAVQRLPAPATGSGLLQAIRARRSVREHTAAPMTLAELSALCAAAAGDPAASPTRDPFLTGTAPLALCVLVRDVTGLRPGAYRYVPAEHGLRLVRAGDLSSACMEAALQQEFCGAADVVFAKTVRWDDLAFPDGDRGYRYACLRAGLMGEGLYLEGTALGLGVCGVGAFRDPDVADLLGIDPRQEVPLYLTAVGR